MDSKNAPGCTHEEKDGECMRCRLYTPQFPPNSSGRWLQLILDGTVDLTELDHSRKDILIKILAEKLLEEKLSVLQLQSAMSKKGKHLPHQLLCLKSICVFFLYFVHIDPKSKK